MSRSPGSKVQLQMVAFGTHHPKTLEAAIKVMASRKGFKVTGLVLTNKDGQAYMIDNGEAMELNGRTV